MKVAEVVAGKLVPAVRVRLGVGRGLRDVLETIVIYRRGPRSATVRPAAEVKFFGRHREAASGMAH